MSITFSVEKHPDLDVNLSNANALAMLGLMQVGADAAGEIAPAQLDAVIRRLTRAINSAQRRQIATMEDYSLGNFISFGRDDAYVQRTAARLLELTVTARRNGVSVYWG
ncbi:MAG: DUF1840 family protein [Lautropia sp.]